MSWNTHGTRGGQGSLHEDVWREAVPLIAPRYGLSDVGLDNTSKQFGIPVPPRGWWAKIKAEHSKRKAPLPAPPAAGTRDIP
jgi:hypothetical protein